jgi:hypothetical protein
MSNHVSTNIPSSVQIDLPLEVQILFFNYAIEMGWWFQDDFGEIWAWAFRG